MAQGRGRVLLCSDLDRTLLPNGAAPESPRARDVLAQLAAREELTLAYVTGRHLALLRQAIDEYHIPVPRFAIGDVGSTIYSVDGERWLPWPEWSQCIAPDWNGLSRGQLEVLFQDLAVLRLQPPERQNTFKLSYYTPVQFSRGALLGCMEARLEAHGVRASLVWSVDEAAGVGLLDVLPASANKLHAVRFLMQALGFAAEQTVFAGDSGNDLAVLTSGLQAVLVANAAPELRDEALRLAAARGVGDRLYMARGGFLGMNGNYAAGVLEGLAHFVPGTRAWMDPSTSRRCR